MHIITFDLTHTGDVVLLENVRFYPEEEANNAQFAHKLAANADVYVNDAFGTAHRAHGSTEGVAKHLSPAVAGFLLQKVQSNARFVLLPLCCMIFISSLLNAGLAS